MADHLVSALAAAILRILSSASLQEIGRLWGLKDELNKLRSTFTTIQLVLQDAEIKQRKSGSLQNWLKELKDAAYDAENVLDEMATEDLRRKMGSERGKSFLNFRNPLQFRYKMAQKVKNIRERLDVIAEERLKFHLGEGVVENRFGVTPESRQTTSLVNESKIYGRQEEKEKIMEKLLDNARSHDELSVYAIWGMGGLGKTTLAQMAYNDERTERHFELRIWVCVSDDFSIQRLVRAIIESVDGGACNLLELDALQRHLRGRLRGKRFLLVLDDVWNENRRLWDGLQEVLRCDSKGSVLMVTTRIQKVASMMAINDVHQIGYLTQEDSWSLFKERAFSITEEEENFVAIGKEIVHKCGGVPLAIKALGSLMQLKCSESEWLTIKESEIWQLSDDENGILPALRLSYDNLLPQLRQCFAYCCVFPKDYKMQVDWLIQLWMANGFVPSDGLTELPLAGYSIFKELEWRCFFQDVTTGDRGNMTCTMHDLMHDLAISVMGHETSNCGQVVKMPTTLRHLSFGPRTIDAVPDNESTLNLPNDGSLRSIIEPCTSWVDHEGFSSFLSKQKYLRALHVEAPIIKNLPNLVCKLKYLRYLCMSCNNSRELPESLTRLSNLQTLKLTNSVFLRELPKNLKVMKNLMFVEIPDSSSLVCTPPELRDLTYLRSLSIFIVGQDASHQIDQLKELNLGGRLSIKGLENVRNSEDAKRANLMAKRNLTCLSLSWTKDIKNDSAEHFEEVLQSLQPHQNLEEICIERYQGSRFPNWMSTLDFKNLKNITLDSCQMCEQLPPLGKLPSLTYLNLKKMDSVKHLGAEWHGDGESAFPSLRTLHVYDLPNLKEWSLPDSVDCFPRLTNLLIRMCPKLIGLPFLPNILHLNIDCDNAELLTSISLLSSLKYLDLQCTKGVEVPSGDPLQNFMALEPLEISGLHIRTPTNVFVSLSVLKNLTLVLCSGHEHLLQGLKYLNSLETLNFFRCHDLTSFPAAAFEDLPSLRTLSFQYCNKLKPLLGPLKRTALQYKLLLNHLPELKYLPESMKQLSSLRELEICNCDGLCSLPDWLKCLESLCVFRITDCRNLNCLPDGFRCVKSLRTLDIWGCPKLEKRCKKPKGEDWPKISHIPVIQINGRTIQSLDV